MEFYIGQIIMFGGNFSIRNFTMASGQLLAISQWSALFSLYGTMYGGDGRTTFGVPDFRGRVPMSFGQGPGLPNYVEGARSGVYESYLNISNLPAHNHSAGYAAAPSVATSSGDGTTDEPGGNILALATAGSMYSPPNTADGSLGGVNGGSIIVGNTGSGTGFTNMQPYQVIGFQVCLQGIFPSRN